jgi:hypothetical protein
MELELSLRRVVGDSWSSCPVKSQGRFGERRRTTATRGDRRQLRLGTAMRVEVRRLIVN